MPFHQPDAIKYFSFNSLSDAGVVHAIFTRRGGVSQAPWTALNVGGTVGDAPAAVAENRRRSFQALGRQPASLFDVWQVHGTEVACADKPRSPEQPHQRADAILTQSPGVTLFMRFADCVPILLYDPVQRVVGLVHAGWLGTVSRTAAAAVHVLQQRYRTKPENLLAGIGPSIGLHHYEVGPEVADKVRQAFGTAARGLLAPASACDQTGKLPADDGQGKVKFDLWDANRVILEQAGVRHIEVAGICTACNLEEWYSHRGEAGRTGRFGALIALRD